MSFRVDIKCNQCHKPIFIREGYESNQLDLEQIHAIVEQAKKPNICKRCKDSLID